MKKRVLKFLHSIKKAPDRKHYLEFVTAALSIPVLLTVILVNLNSLNATKQKEATPTSSPSPREIIIRESSNSGNTVPTVAPTNAEICKKEIGPVSVSYPKEGATITENPVNFIIKYEDKSYCSVVWSYRINNGSWSEFSSNSPSVYSMPNGNIKFELRVQSTVTEEQEKIERNFTYQSGTSVSTLTPTPTTTQ